MSSPVASRTATVLSLATTAAAAAYLLYCRHRHQRSTRDLEARAGPCPACGCALYLDAAVPVMRCPRCETAAAKPGKAGTCKLDGEGSVVDFEPGTFSGEGDLLGVLKDEVQWEQHDDRLDDGRVVTQARLIAYQATVAGHLYGYPGIVKSLRASRFTPTVDKLRRDIERRTGLRFNSAHLNLCECSPALPGSLAARAHFHVRRVFLTVAFVPRVQIVTAATT